MTGLTPGEVAARSHYIGWRLQELSEAERQAVETQAACIQAGSDLDHDQALELLFLLVTYLNRAPRCMRGAPDP